MPPLQDCLQTGDTCFIAKVSIYGMKTSSSVGNAELDEVRDEKDRLIEASERLETSLKEKIISLENNRQMLKWYGPLWCFQLLLCGCESFRPLMLVVGCCGFELWSHSEMSEFL